MRKLVSANSNIKLITPAAIIARWQPLAEAQTDGNTISIMDVIDADYGVSTKRIHAALRAIGDNPVTVLLNSPGGSLIEGVAIYNLLKSHNQQVTVKVLALAASSASIIAMAGDKIEVMKGANLMVHNAWSFAIGNKHDLTEAASFLAKFDEDMKAIYMERTGLSHEEVTALLDAETWLNGEQAVARGFADIATDEEAKGEPSAHLAALKTIEFALQASGLSRSERRELIKNFTNGKPSAAIESKAKPSADLSETAAIAAKLCNILN